MSRLTIAVLLVVLACTLTEARTRNEKAIASKAKRSIGIGISAGLNDPITLAAANLVVSLVNSQVGEADLQVSLLNIASVNLEVGLLSLYLDIVVNLDVLNVVLGTHSNAQCSARVGASLLGQISNVDQISCGGLLVNVGVHVG